MIWQICKSQGVCLYGLMPRPSLGSTSWHHSRNQYVEFMFRKDECASFKNAEQNYLVKVLTARYKK